MTSPSLILLFSTALPTLAATPSSSPLVSVGGSVGTRPASVQHHATALVHNNSGTTLTLFIDHLPAFTTAPNERLVLALSPGDHLIRAGYDQFGSKQVYFAERLTVVPGRAATTIVPAETTARIAIQNPEKTGATLLVDGVSAGRLEAGATRIQSLPVGPHAMALVFDDGRQDHETLSLQPYIEQSWIANPPPPTGTLVVQNPLPIPIELVCSRGGIRTVPAYGSTRYEHLVAGNFALTARRITDELIDQEAPRVIAGRTRTWRVDPPTTGLIHVDNDLGIPSVVDVDGKPRLSLAAEQDRTLLVDLGWHLMRVRDARGRVVQERWVEVQPYDSSALHYGHDSRPGTAVALVATSSGSSCTMTP